MPIIAQRPDRYLRAPRLVRRAGGVGLRTIAWEPPRERSLEWTLDADGAVTGDARDAGPPEADEAACELRVAGGALAVEIRRDGPRTRVVVSGAGTGDVVAWDARATAAAPCIAVAPDGGAWIAFHHNVREDMGVPDLAKWIALLHVDARGVVSEPVAEMLDRDRDREGEEQSFEFPSLVVGPDGALALFGRGSHRFWRQDLTAAGFTPRAPLGGGEWGCRGRRVAALLRDDGLIVTARREREGIVVDVLDGPEGGAPRLRTAHVGVVAVSASDPRPAAAREGLRTLFGDIHQHSAHSDGIGTEDEPFLRARWTYGDDFCALSDHESFLGSRIGPSEQALLEAAADRHDAPGTFATLYAYEYTGKKHPGPGHKVVYPPRAGLPIVSRDDFPEGVDLVARVREQGGLAIPHHVGWTGADERAHDPRVQPVWEICSCHGCYEHFAHALGQRGDLRDQMIDAVLRRGHRFGFVASSDGHGLLFHHGVARKRDPFRTGLAAVQATACTREAILAALRARRCYATSGVKILLDVDAEGRPMGSELPADGPIAVRATATGTAPIASLTLVGPAGPLARVTPGALDAVIEAKVQAAYVYARVEQTDGEMAWSSPVFTACPLDAGAS